VVDPFPMITATQHLEASPKPSHGPHKASERYLDGEDVNEADHLLTMLQFVFAEGGTQVNELLQALEALRTHLRKKYYAG
jgi:hypothetical protein